MYQPSDTSQQPTSVLEYWLSESHGMDDDEARFDRQRYAYLQRVVDGRYRDPLRMENR